MSTASFWRWTALQRRKLLDYSHSILCNSCTFLPLPSLTEPPPEMLGIHHWATIPQQSSCESDMITRPCRLGAREGPWGQQWGWAGHWDSEVYTVGAQMFGRTSEVSWGSKKPAWDHIYCGLTTEVVRTTCIIIAHQPWHSTCISRCSGRICRGRRKH